MVDGLLSVVFNVHCPAQTAVGQIDHDGILTDTALFILHAEQNVHLPVQICKIYRKAPVGLPGQVEALLVAETEFPVADGVRDATHDRLPSLLPQTKAASPEAESPVITAFMPSGYLLFMSTR
jgi:hypothetical protein